MNIRLIFHHWYKGNNTMDRLDSRTGHFHGGTTFKASIYLNYEEQCDLKDAIAAGYEPCFLLVLPPKPTVEPGSYKRARGAIPWREGDESAEITIRRQRDAE